MDLLDLLLDHDHWATRTLLDTCAALPDEQLDQPFDIGHRTLRATFEHIIFAFPFWGAFLTGQPAEPEPADRSIASLIDAHERTHGDFMRICRQLRDEGRLGEVYSDHYGVKKTFGGTILMVNQHGAEHRTEILHILERLGIPDLPEVDLGVWEYYQLNT